MLDINPLSHSSVIELQRTQTFLVFSSLFQNVLETTGVLRTWLSLAGDYGKVVADHETSLIRSCKPSS